MVDASAALPNGRSDFRSKRALRRPLALDPREATAWLLPDGGDLAAVPPAEDATDDRQHRTGDVGPDSGEFLGCGTVGDPHEEGSGHWWADPAELAAHGLDGWIVPLGEVDRLELGLLVVKVLHCNRLQVCDRRMGSGSVGG
jgi:hypothetical protein